MRIFAILQTNYKKLEKMMRRFWAVFFLILSVCLAVGCADTEQAENSIESNEAKLSRDEEVIGHSSYMFTENSDETIAESLAEETSAAESSDEESLLEESFETSVTLPDPMGKLVSVSLLTAENVSLANDLHFSIDEETATAILTIDHQHHVPLQVLTSARLTVVAENGEAFFETEAVDLTKEVLCGVVDQNGQTKTYTLLVDRSAHQIPIVEITLSGGKAVEQIDRNQTTPMTFTLDCSMLEGYESFAALSGKIRGRGNSTWLWDKKPYKIKLDKKAALLGLDDNRDWVLLANYVDKTLIRNTVAFEMGRSLEHIAWAPHQVPVDLFVNGEYLGVYALGEHMEVANGRVDIEPTVETDTDFLLEIGGMEEDDVVDVHYFHTPDLLARFITYHTPDENDITEEQKKFLYDYFAQTEHAIKSGEGYEAYLDVDSLIDWMILHELCYNLDSCFRRSCFMIKEKGGKLKMGPIWDFDIAFGNFYRDNPDYDDWATVGSDEEGSYIHVTWCNYLLQDKDFCARFAARWNEVRDRLLDTANNTIDQYSRALYISQQANFEVWQIMGKRVGCQAKWCNAADSYEEQIAYLKNFLQTRASWLDNAVKELGA